MTLLNDLIDTSNAERMVQLERREKGVIIEGDFEGSVTGSWVTLSSSGAGIVSYNKKKYTTVPIGFVSAPAGTGVELSYANGVYYSKF